VHGVNVMNEGLWRRYVWHMAILVWIFAVGFYLESKLPIKVANVASQASNSSISLANASIRLAVPSVSLPMPPAYQADKKEKAKSVKALVVTQPLNIADDSGEALLLEQEKGAGPAIIIFWPDSVADRDWLKQRLYGCGVRLARFDGAGLTSIEKSTYALSDFIRPVEVRLSSLEQKRINALVGQGRVVRVFPRYLDERMLASLNRLADGELKKTKKVSAYYTKKGGSLYITSIIMDGSIFKKELELLPVNGCGRISS